MLEREWRAESAPAARVAIEPAEPLTLSRRGLCAARPAATASAGTRTSRCSAGCVLRGRCSACKTPISAALPARIEGFTGVVCSPCRLALRRSTADSRCCGAVRRHADRAGRHRLGHHLAARQPDAAAAVAGHRRRRARWLLDPAAAGGRPGRRGGLSSLWSVYWLFKLPPARRAWASATSSCSRRSAPWLGLKMILPIVLIASAIGAVVGKA